MLIFKTPVLMEVTQNFQSCVSVVNESNKLLCCKDLKIQSYKLVISHELINIFE